MRSQRVSGFEPAAGTAPKRPGRRAGGHVRTLALTRPLQASLPNTAGVQSAGRSRARHACPVTLWIAAAVTAFGQEKVNRIPRYHPSGVMAGRECDGLTDPVRDPAGTGTERGNWVSWTLEEYGQGAALPV